MTGFDLVQRIWARLGANPTFYPQNEVMRSGINPAMRLLCLLKPEALVQRVTTTVLAEQLFIDLREVSSRCARLDRVVLGDVTTDAPTRTPYGELHDLLPTSLDKIAWQREWFKQRGTPHYYYLHGRHWLAVYKRPQADRTLTLVYRAIPTAFTANTMSNTPELAEAWHPVIADVGTALLLLKEGSTQVEKALGTLRVIFGADILGGVAQELSQQPPTQPIRATAA